MPITVRDASAADAVAVVHLVAELADSEAWPLELTEEYVPAYLGFPGTHVLLAEQDGRAVGLLAYSLRPGLFHGGSWGCIDELIVTATAQGKGVGDALVSEALRRFEALGCREAAVSTELDNDRAAALYRKHGLTDESRQLEKHF